MNLTIIINTGKKLVRAENEWFRVDPRLKETEQSTCQAYTKSGYDRGHVTPSGISYIQL